MIFGIMTRLYNFEGGIKNLSPPPETGENFECKSVMYYYNEQECILNAETRMTKPDLFIPEGEEFQVNIIVFSQL